MGTSRRVTRESPRAANPTKRRRAVEHHAPLLAEGLLHFFMAHAATTDQIIFCRDIFGEIKRRA